MKKNRHLLLAAFALGLSLLVASCGVKPTVVDISLLTGKWVSGTEYYRYSADGSGATWDTSDDVSEEEAQPFTWDYNDKTNKLTLYHQMEMGSVVPKSYTIKTLNAVMLTYTDNYDRTYTFSRVTRF